jgi:uncharacterized protein
MKLRYGLFFGDIYYFILVIPATLLALYAQYRVKSTFGKYSRISNMRRLTGADVARQILDQNDLHDISVQAVRGNLTDHYDPTKKVVRLSQSVYSSTSVAAIGVAAHETGHAIQHMEKYVPLGLRSLLVPAARIGSGFGPYMAIFGLFLGYPMLVDIGIILFAGAVAFYLITLPVEFNASKRALAILEDSGMLSREEIVPARKVLRAAAMTYVASAAVAMASLLRLILLSGRRR